MGLIYFVGLPCARLFAAENLGVLLSKGLLSVAPRSAARSMPEPAAVTGFVTEGT